MIGNINKARAEFYKRFNGLIYGVYVFAFQRWQQLKGKQGFTFAVCNVFGNFHCMLFFFRSSDWMPAISRFP